MQTYEDLKKRVYELEKELIEHKKIEEYLLKNDEKYRNILEKMEEGYYEVDLKGDLIFCNDALCSIHGYPRDELMGMNNRGYSSSVEQKKFFGSLMKYTKKASHPR